MERPIAESSYMLGSWFSLSIVLTGGSFIGINALQLPVVFFCGLLAVAFFGVLYVTSYLFLNKTTFYRDRIEVTYFIKHASLKKRTIDLIDVQKIVYAYTGGKGSAGDGQVKVYYQDISKSRILKCSMDNPTAARVYNALKKENVKMVLKPSWVLQEYGCP